jgi:hypothetical protein
VKIIIAVTHSPGLEGQGAEPARNVKVTNMNQMIDITRQAQIGPDLIFTLLPTENEKY